MRVFACLAAAVAVTAVIIATPCWSKLIVTGPDDQFLPGDSLPAVAIALAQGGETIHLSLVMSADERIVVLRDTILNDFTDVAQVFPDKVRDDGLFHIMDFTLAELQQLSLGGEESAKPLASVRSTPPPRVSIATLEEVLGVIQAMEVNQQRSIGIVGEIKKSWQYLFEQKDISKSVINVFKHYGYTNTTSSLILASYDPEELKRIHDRLLPEAGIDLKILQLTEDNTGHQTKRFELGRWQHYSYDWLFTKFGLKAISGYADMIGLQPGFLVNLHGDLLNQEYVEDVHMLGMQIIINPLDRPLAPSLPDGDDVEALAETLLFTAGADGIITSYDKEIRALLENRSADQTIGNKSTIELLLETMKKQQDN